MARPATQNSLAERELDKAEEQFKAYDENIKSLTHDRMNQAPVKEFEEQTKMSSKDLNKAKDIYLKPDKTIGCRDKFNEDYREQYNHDKQYVQFIAENHEIIGETIEVWTRPYGGMPAEFWKVPVNKPVWGPRYLAEQIKRCKYHRLKMEQSQIVAADGMGSYYGQMAVDTAIPRLDARPVTSSRSYFMGAGNF
jgi:hypothetical protein